MPPAEVVKAVAYGYGLISENPILAKHELRETIRDRVNPRLAKLLAADPTEIVLTRNATEALYLAALGLALEPGDEVLLTSQEHPAGRQPWEYRKHLQDIRVKEVFIPSPFEHEDQVVERIFSGISHRTRALAFCHVTRGGHLYPVKRLAAMARERGITSVVDGAQAIGMLPVDLHDLGCDVYAASLHKWMLGPMGTGMFYVRKDARKRIRSLFSPDSNTEQPNYALGGTADLPVRAALNAALSFVDGIGIRAIERRNRYLSDYLKVRLARMPSVQLMSGPTPQTSAPGSTIFEMDGVDALGVVPRLAKEKGIHIDEHTRDGHNAIRVSTHFYNTRREIDRLIVALKAL